MSLDLAEFHRSLKTLKPDVKLDDGQMDVLIPAGTAEIRIVYEPLEKATLGGLLSLPRANVTLQFDGLDEAGRQRFLARFDKAFQRGGG
ncbi:MAG: hypothetical protein ACTSP0_03320 [Alphaproteobacteria bacterium]